LTPADRARWEAADFASLSVGWAEAGISLTNRTFEAAVRIAAWRAGTAVDPDQSLGMVEGPEGRAPSAERLFLSQAGIHYPRNY
jgi:hypothetical protein